MRVASKLREALIEAKAAIELLNRGFTIKAAGRAFQAWRALLTALAELNGLAAGEAGDGEGGGIPVGQMRGVSYALKGRYEGLPLWTNTALSLYDYWLYGADPDMAASHYRSQEEAARDIIELVKRIAEMAKHAMASLQGREA
jgi:hypothetical protein